MSYSVHEEVKALIRTLLLPPSGMYWFDNANHCFSNVTLNKSKAEIRGKKFKMFVFYILMRKIRTKVLSVSDSNTQHCNAFSSFQLGETLNYLFVQLFIFLTMCFNYKICKISAFGVLAFIR